MHVHPGRVRTLPPGLSILFSCPRALLRARQLFTAKKGSGVLRLAALSVARGDLSVEKSPKRRVAVARAPSNRDTERGLPTRLRREILRERESERGGEERRPQREEQQRGGRLIAARLHRELHLPAREALLSGASGKTDVPGKRERESRGERLRLRLACAFAQDGGDRAFCPSRAPRSSHGSSSPARQLPRPGRLGRQRWSTVSTVSTVSRGPRRKGARRPGVPGGLGRIKQLAGGEFAGKRGGKRGGKTRRAERTKR